jgi:hypothetical protein
MSKLLRLPVVLLVALAMALLWAWPATADDPPAPTAEECLAVPAPDGCPTPSEPLAGDESGAADTGAGDDQAGRQEAAAAEVDPLPLPPVPCDALPGVGLPPCAPPNCDALPTDVLPDCDPADPPTCDRFPDLPGLPFCQLPDSDCPPPGTASAAATDGECTPPLTCDQFAQLFGFGDDCGDIPLCIPRDQVPAGFPIPVPAPPLCGPGAGGTPTPPTGGGSNKPPTAHPPAAQQHDVYYENCDDARAKGAAPVYAGQPGYRPGLDSDSDGIGCEDDTSPAVTPVSTPTVYSGTLAYTGVDLEPMLRLAAILVSSGTLLVLAGQRRA